MQIKDLRPASDFARCFGVKGLIYGPPGSSKTPTINTCPRPVMLACEPGMLSMRGSNVPTFQAFTATLIDDFFKWLFGSTETKNFDTVAIDSTSQMAEIYLAEAKKNNKHGLASYGEMAVNTLKQLETLYYLKEKHTYLIAKEQISEDNGIRIRRPYFPGQQLNVEIPHKYDCVLRLANHNVPSVGTVKAFRCIGSLEETARNRTGTLDEFEFPDFTKLVLKAMS
jgi:hypothetical protein